MPDALRTHNPRLSSALMIRLILALSSILLVSGSTIARGQFPNFAAADLVLGASDFSSVGTAALTSSGLDSPVGIAIDPTSGKLFVVCVSQSRILRFADPASLANGAAAEAVIGQVDFTSSVRATTAGNLRDPYNLHIDSLGRLWIAEYSNNRVLMFEDASDLPVSGATADLVLGQPDFTSRDPGTSDTTMRNPTAVFVDADDNVWVADFNNYRVLKFANASALSNGSPATSVLGQEDFSASSFSTTAETMKAPVSVFVDAERRLWVAAKDDHRILRFDNAASLANGAPASAVLGQPDFTTGTRGTTAGKMWNPKAAIVDAAGTLYVSDDENHRILVFKNAAARANGAPADRVIGQADFITNTSGTTNRKLQSPWGIAVDAKGALWVGDASNHRVLRFSADRFVAAPKIKGRLPKSTGSARLRIKGTATDPSGIAGIRFKISRKPTQLATGTSIWKFSAKLKPGVNTILIQAEDRAGNVSPPKRVKVRLK